MGIVLKLKGRNTYTSFSVDLNDPKDLESLDTIIHELYPDRLVSFMHRIYSDDTPYRYGIDAIKEAFLKTPEGTYQHQLLRDILNTTFHDARLDMDHAWEKTMAVFDTSDLTQLAGLHYAMTILDYDARKRRVSMHDLFSLLGVRALSLDALDVLLRREPPDTPLHAMREKILTVARGIVRVLDLSLFVDRKKNPEPYHRCDPNGQTIAHHIALGTLFPGAEQIAFDPQKDRGILDLTNFEGKTVEEVYRARLAREADVQLTASP